jgi:GNAT superfamily N-acetyltransferase
VSARETRAGDVDLRIAPPADDADRAWLRALWHREWGGETMVSRGRLHRLADLPALLAWHGGERAGAATYWVEGSQCELTSLNALAQWQGVGTALLVAVEDAAHRAGCARLWLITTNDNVDALRFYQRRGYRLTAVHPGAVDRARHLKPSIPPTGRYGIPLRDELELEKLLAVMRDP